MAIAVAWWLQPTTCKFMAVLFLGEERKARRAKARNSAARFVPQAGYREPGSRKPLLYTMAEDFGTVGRSTEHRLLAPSFRRSARERGARASRAEFRAAA